MGYRSSLSAAVLAGADLVRLGIQVPQVLVPQHPAVIEGVAVGAVVVAVRRVVTVSVVTIVGLKIRISKIAVKLCTINPVSARSTL